MRKLFAVLFLAVFMTSCGFQSIPKANNEVEASFAEIQNQYKRRSDLIPNLVNTVKGYASHEKETLAAVVNARSKASQITVDPTKLNPENLKKYGQAQGQLSQALGRLMVVAERYPDLKASQNFRDLQAQLEGTENRITVARNRYIRSIQKFNDLVTVPPSSWTNSIMYKYDKKPQFQVENYEEVKNAPKVEF